MQEKQVWELNGRQLPVIIHYERRNGSRVSIGKKAVLIRIPAVYDLPQRVSQLEWARDWLETVVKKKPEAVEHLLIEELANEYHLNIWGTDHKVTISYNSENYIHGKYKENVIEVSIADSLTLYQKKQELMKFISSLVAKKYLTPFKNKVAEVNKRTLKVSYDAVRLKHMRSRWGSCSSAGNLNFSTRLLLCPEFVIEYLIVHELAHRKEMNHSHKFWRHVELAMPDYLRAEEWLNKHGNKVNFV